MFSSLKTALGAFAFLLCCTVFTSCQKDHDLVSSYMVKESKFDVESIVEIEQDLEELTDMGATNVVEGIVKISK